jgi:5-methyltetrahydrofolate--homocysteine methyltransferase
MKTLNNFIKDIREKVLVYDGSKGYMLQTLGLNGGECGEYWNITHPEEVRKIYEAYKNAGSDVIQTNTFPGNRTNLEKHGLGDKVYEINYAGVRLAKEVMGKDGYVAASIGPTGLLFEPSGQLTFDQAYEIYTQQVKAVYDGGADIINFETFTDLAEMRAALLAAKENTDLPVICSLSFEANGRTLMGTDPRTAAIVLNSLGADMVGINCSFGPEQMLPIVKEMWEAGGVYLSVKPNAGLPEVVDGQTVYKENADDFARIASEFARYGARLIGGCCGTTPEFVSAIKERLSGIEVPKIEYKTERVITSGIKLLEVDREDGLSIARICASEDAELMQKLKSGSIDFVVDLAMDLAGEGYDAIYINVDGVSEDETLLSKVVNAAQGYLREPFIIETECSNSLSPALRLYNGKAGVVVDGYGRAVMEDLLATASKYGSTIINSELLGR